VVVGATTDEAVDLPVVALELALCDVVHALFVGHEDEN
jgi:hypothetical protein